jgi:hypothetical protein
MALKPAAELAALCGIMALRGMFAPLRVALWVANQAKNVVWIWLAPVVRALCDGTAVAADAFFSWVVAPVVSVGVCLLVIMLTMPLLLISISAAWVATMCFALYMAALGISIVAAHGVRHADRPQSPEDEWSVGDGRTWTEDGNGAFTSKLRCVEPLSPRQGTIGASWFRRPKDVKIRN